jgi:hypothetical protein
MDPFHEGERAVQQLFGVRERMAEIGSRVIRDAMPDQHRDFFAKLPFVVVAAADANGDPWVSAIAGAPGFVDSPTAQQLTIAAARDRDDPVLGAGLRVGAAIGLLGIEPHTRRRNRANGTIGALDPSTLTIEVRESFGNCPRHIHPRRAEHDPSPHERTTYVRTGLDDAARSLVAAADTFFLASAHPEVGVDASHRGGAPGFVRVDGDVVTVPDFGGNMFFNSIGNLLVNPRAGLLFVDFATGDLLHLTADAEIVWHGAELEAHAEAERLLRFTVRRMIRRTAALACVWS